MSFMHADSEESIKKKSFVAPAQLLGGGPTSSVMMQKYGVHKVIRRLTLTWMYPSILSCVQA